MWHGNHRQDLVRFNFRYYFYALMFICPGYIGVVSLSLGSWIKTVGLLGIGDYRDFHCFNHGRLSLCLEEEGVGVEVENNAELCPL